MKQSILGGVAALLLASSNTVAATSTPKGFTDDFDAAIKSAKESNRLVYACFSGSDWCGWCQRLDKEVLSKQAFLDGVSGDFVLLYVDTPNNTELLGEKAKTQNPKLVEKYEIRGFPTALILDADGKTVAQTGYRRGGAAKYVKHLKALKKNAAEIQRLRSEIDKLEAQLQKLENEE